MAKGAVIAAIAAGLVIGVGLGLSSERLAGFAPTPALSVFTGEPRAADQWVQSLYPADDILDTRLVATVGDTDVYAVRSTIDLSIGVQSAGPMVCIVAEAPGLRYTPDICTPESVFRQQGLRGVLAGSADNPDAFLVAVAPTNRLLTVVWHPSGDIEVSDVTDEIVIAPDDLYTDAERDAGLDIPLISGLRGSLIDPEVEAFLAEYLSEPELGPVRMSESSGAGNVTASYLSVHPGTQPGQPRDVCLTGRVNSDLFPPACTTMAAFRDDGLDVEVPSREGGVIVLTAMPMGGVGVDTTRSRPE
ncbi:hypothetical protein EV141_1420 [Microcella putealis]|uniref:Uncharacterized protein n=1 Tax=Microcella putealis TaxID=337005 RepID=A0A4Q7LTY4_9MICO|nr:hypothetical protein [Microcella putealis]RZS57702.1 hypothetical protein EV141_1420 [Microcella putealis]TQM24769.1 hypothetical protein BJ957_1029 [Microcella putealis]